MKDTEMLSYDEPLLPGLVFQLILVCDKLSQLVRSSARGISCLLIVAPWLEHPGMSGTLVSI